jgi:hypothetical protein
MMMTSSRQRRSPKSKYSSSENGGGGGGGGGGLTVQDGSQESLMTGVSAKISSNPSIGLPLPKKRRRKIHRRTSLATGRRVRFCFLVTASTFVLVACFYILENHNRTMQRQQYGSYKNQGPGAEPDSSVLERFSKVGTGPMCTTLSAADVSYTLVTQFSHDRLWMMEQHCARWGPHPISIAVLTNKTVSSIHQELTEMGCLSEQYISVQTLSLQDSSSGKLADYPVNVLRNMALTKVQTSHMAYVDVDFWESTNLHTNLMRLHVRQALSMDPKNALVLPAFQMLRQCKELRECPENNIPVMPHDQNELFDLFRHKNATQFDPSNRGGHGSTRYKDWMDQTEELLPITCVLSNRYEPYLVVRYCRDLPPFQTAFSGYGKNKMTWVMQLVRSGYSFWQLGESFLVHYPHLDSSARMLWNGGPHGEQLSKPKPGTFVADYKRGQTDQTFIEFREWLNDEIHDKTRIPKCDEAMDDDAKLWVDGDDDNARTTYDEYDEEADDTNVVEEEEDNVTDEETDGAQVEEEDEQTDDAQVEEEEESPLDGNGDGNDGEAGYAYL